MKKTPNTNAIVKALLNKLDDRQKAVIEGRYGLEDGAVITLAKIGGKYGITRERVRQIESLALDTIKSAGTLDDQKLFIELVRNYLENAGGLKRELELLHDLRALFNLKANSVNDNQLRFLLESAHEFKFSKEVQSYHAFWYLNEGAKKSAEKFSKDLLIALKDKKEEILTSQGFTGVFAGVFKNHNLSEVVAMNYAVINKKFEKNVYGDHGLSSWSEINPKTARDWAHLVLKKEKKPLHFTEIAKVVNDLRYSKKVHHQTIHNELIKDDKFVLVGKGTYGLREFGLTPGTAREVIVHLIKKHGPLAANDVVTKILSERILKPNTILINLQNKKHFVRQGDGRYTIKEA